MNTTMWYDQFVDQILKCECSESSSKWTKATCGHWDQDVDPNKLMDALKRHNKKSRQKKYIYMVTFTIDPKKHPDSSLVENQIVEYIKKQPKRDQLHITSATMVRELTKKGQPHWHCMFHTTKPLRKDAFIQYKRVFGNPDISKNKRTNDADIEAYMNKSDDWITLK